jgi:hypothetical protein
MLPNDEVCLGCISERCGKLANRQWMQTEQARLGMLFMEGWGILWLKATIDLQHHLFVMSLHGVLHLAPIKEDVQDVLDIGTGTGIWAIEFGKASRYFCPIARLLPTASFKISLRVYHRHRPESHSASIVSRECLRSSRASI